MPSAILERSGAGSAFRGRVEERHFCRKRFAEERTVEDHFDAGAFREPRGGHDLFPGGKDGVPVSHKRHSFSRIAGNDHRTGAVEIRLLAEAGDAAAVRSAGLAGRDAENEKHDDEGERTVREVQGVVLRVDSGAERPSAARLPFAACRPSASAPRSPVLRRRASRMGRTNTFPLPRSPVCAIR